MTEVKILLFRTCLLTVIAFGTCASEEGERCTDDSGTQGTCKVIENCPAAKEAVQKGSRPKICGFKGHSPIVCCSEQINDWNPSPEAITSSRPGEKAEYWCNEYRNLCPVSLLGGELAFPKEFPHMAAIGYGPQENILWGCGGSLVSDKFVLTAAHCLHSRGSGSVKWVLLATEVTRSVNEEKSPNARRGQTHPVIRNIRHPGYKPPSKYHDIALLEIGPALEPNPLSLNTRELHPACLPLEFTKNPRKIIATGWGRVGFGEETSPDLLKVTLDILDSSICNKTYEIEIRTTSQLTRGIDNTMICAGVLSGDKDTCQGDSGGPIQVPIKETCLYEIWGITSFGKICGIANSPAVYMRVPEYVPWIESIIWP